ncbi:hypothetical protein ACOSQ2_018070 [Xanthoceras sorbifolium]
MKTIMAKTPHDSSFSFSRRFLNWKKKVEDEDDMEEILTNSTSQHFCEEDKEEELKISMPTEMTVLPRRKKNSSMAAVSKLRSALTVFGKSRSSYHSHSGLGSRVIGTLFGYRRGHVHIAFQEDAKLSPGFLIELATPTSVLVREMASGLVRIALECDKKIEKKGVRLLEEGTWRTYCNGKKCGFAMKRECGAEEGNILKVVEPISMGAGVLPGNNGCDGELMYMRARFERVVGSKDSEAFYMMNPDCSGGPELSVYLLRV